MALKTPSIAFELFWQSISQCSGEAHFEGEGPPTHSSEVMHFGHTKPDALKWSLFENHEI